MENSLRMLTMAAGIFITCVIVSFTLLVMREGLNLGRIFVSDINEYEREYEEHRLTKFDTERVSGAEVINITRRYQKEIQITVTNGAESRVFSKANELKIYENSPERGFYIEPYEEYVGSVTRDTNGRIAGLIFTLKRG